MMLHIPHFKAGEGLILWRSHFNLTRSLKLCLYTGNIKTLFLPYCNFIPQKVFFSFPEVATILCHKN